MKTFKHLYNDPILCELKREEYNGKRYYISPTGKRLPSVTTFLSHFKGDAIQKWRKKVGEEEANKISARASRRGTAVHSIMESYLANEERSVFLNDNVMPDVKFMFHIAEKELDKVDNIHYIETMLYSEVVGLAGQCDLIAEWEGTLSIIDWKTSTKLKKEEWIESYFLQATCYSLMFEEMTGIQAKQIVIFILVDGETKPQIFIKNRRDYIPLLAQRLKEYRNANSV
jgi:genome maintenance exonuclease 1